MKFRKTTFTFCGSPEDVIQFDPDIDRHIDN